MTRWIGALGILMLGVLVVGGALAPADAADVRIGVNIGVPPVVVAPPAPVVVAPPVVIAPGTPVYYYGTSYYTFHNGAWFLGPGYGGPWAYVPVARVPRPIFAVPHAYRHFHHGPNPHAGPPPWAHGRGHGHGKHKHRGRH
jgi:hypothetical protein